MSTMLQYNPLAIYNFPKELTEKFKSVIKAKLIELDVYVDDELPEYVLILLGNKKTEEQMTEDLNLFLGKSSQQFSIWTHSLLNEFKKYKDKPDQIDDEQLAVEIDSNEFNEENVDEPPPPPQVTNNHKNDVKSRLGSSNSSKKPSRLTSHIGSVIRHDDEDEDEDSHHTRPTVSSVIKVSERKYSVPKSLQPNKSILLKAINDANSSVNESPKQKKSTIQSRLNFPSSENEVNLNKENVKSRLGERKIEFNREETDQDVVSDTKEPRFIITLNGIVRNKLKRQLSAEEPNEQENNVEDEQMDVDSGIPNTTPKKNKIRCIYWPQCDKGDEACPYIHPNKPCDLFPACKFGAKCLYIHPKCRFDLNCTRPDCTFQHSFRATSVVPLPQVHPPPPPQIMLPSPAKLKLNKQQLVECKFGSACRNPTCSYKHANLPPKSALKWIAPTVVVAGAVTTAMSTE